MPDEKLEVIGHAVGTKPLEQVIADLDPEDAKEMRYQRFKRDREIGRREKGLFYTGDFGVDGAELQGFLAREAEELRIAAGIPEPRKPVYDPAMQRTAMQLIDLDVKTNPLDPHAAGAGIGLHLRRALGEERAAALGLTATSFPLQVVSCVISEEPAVFEHALRGQATRRFAFRMLVADLIVRSAFRSRQGISHRDCIDGVALRRSWERIPTAGRALFGDHVDAAIRALAIISPDGQLRLDGNALDVALALAIDGEFSKWLQEKAAEASK